MWSAQLEGCPNCGRVKCYSRGVPVASVSPAVSRLDSPTHLRRCSAFCLLGGYRGPLHSWPVTSRLDHCGRRPRSVQGRRTRTTDIRYSCGDQQLPSQELFKRHCPSSATTAATSGWGAHSPGLSASTRTAVQQRLWCCNWVGSADRERRSAAHPADGVSAAGHPGTVPRPVSASWICPVPEQVSALWWLPARRQRFLSG